VTLSDRPRLGAGRLAELPAGVARPRYDRAALKTGIVHLGIGAFHRAHQAFYTEAVLNAGDLRWGISAASLRSADTAEALNPQDGLYTLAVRGECEALSVIGAVREVLVAPADPAALLKRLADPGVAVVTLTVTEKGYCHDPASGDLDESHPGIRRDLAQPERPETAIGFLAAGIAARRAAGAKPFTVLCCDNLPSNGRTVHRILSQFAALRSPDLGRFVAGEIACPSTMVDRIVPATTDADRAAISAALGLEDAWPVVTEPFTQWVIEDFTGARPAWENAGAELVADVAPFEKMKLRLLNGSHSAIAYLGSLMGVETVADAMAVDELAGFAAGLMDDAAATLDMPAATVAAYKASLLERFRNRALRHLTIQIAMDGSQKLPQRILGPLRERLAKDLPVDRHALVVAAWMRFLTGRDEAGRPLAVRDPLAAELTALADRAGADAERLVAALVGVRAIFGDDLPRDPRFRDAVTKALAALLAKGARASLADYASRS
jgi:fructuronate reductase